MLFRVLRSGSQWCCATLCPTPSIPPLRRWCRRDPLSCSTAILTPPTPQEVGSETEMIYSHSVSLLLPCCFNVFIFLDRGDVALSPEHVSRPPPEAPSCTPPCAPPISPSSPGPGAPGWDREVVCIQPSRSTSPPETLEHPPEEPQNVSSGVSSSKLKNLLLATILYLVYVVLLYINNALYF